MSLVLLYLYCKSDLGEASAIVPFYCRVTVGVSSTVALLLIGQCQCL